MLYAIDIETIDKQGRPCLNWWQGSILCVGICDENLNVQTLSPFNDHTVTYLNEIFANPVNTVLFWNATYDLTWLRYFGVTQNKARVYDPMLLYNLLFNKLGLDCSLRTCAKQFLQQEVMEWRKGISPKELTYKNTQDVIVTLKLWRIFTGILDKTEDKHVIWKYFAELLMPVVDVFVAIQLRGLRVDKIRLKELLRQYEDKKNTAYLELSNKIGNVNINSPKQLSEYLFNKLKLTPIKDKNKSAYYPVDEEVLIELSYTNQVCKDILETRKVVKLLSILESLKEHVDSATQRIYPHFNLNSAVSGRVLSTQPQVQNLSPELRSIFIPSDGYKFILADLNQIELRVAAHLSEDKMLCEAFNTGKDLHQQTADVLKVDRKTGKTINFGILYGMGATSLSKRLNISQQQAKEYIDQFFKLYSGLSQYIQQVHRFVRERKYVASMLGRKRFFDDVSNADLRSAFDHVTQSSASDFLLLILRNLYRRLQDGYIVNQVFDSILLEVTNNSVEQVIPVVKEVMTNFLKSPKLKVPIEVNIKVLDRWE